MEVSNVFAFRAHNYRGTETFSALANGLYLAIAFTVNSEASSKTLIADITGPGTPVATFSKTSAYNQDELNKRQIQYSAALYNLTTGEQLIFTAQGSTGTHNNSAFYVFQLFDIYPELTVEYFQTGIDNTQIGTSHNFNINLPDGVFFGMFSSCKDSGTCSATISVSGADSVEAVPITFSAAGPLASAVSVFEMDSDGTVNVASTNDGGGSYATKQYQLFRIGTTTPPVPPAPGFPVNIQRNNSESIHLDKDLTNILTTQAVLKSDTSLIDPVLLIEVDLASVALANYVTIPQFNRSYFITNIRSVTSDLVELTCHVDVLSSFADEIRANTGIIRRNENDWNLYLNDGTLVSYANPIVSTQEFPNGFTDQSYVLVVAGGRGGGVSTGEGGSIAVTGAESEEMGGNGNNNSKTTGGLVYYAYQQLGKPYWFGTFGNLASQSLLDYKRRQYANYYPTPGNPDFSTQLGERVHDCVGLIKGYRWREDATMSDPVYNASQDVDVAGLYNQCIRYRGTVNPADTSATYPIGCVLFNSDFTHCGVYIGGGELIEARGHFYGVVQNTLASRPNFAYWGIPDWMQVSEDYG